MNRPLERLFPPPPPPKLAILSEMMMKLGRDILWLKVFSNWRKVLMTPSSFQCYDVMTVLMCRNNLPSLWSKELVHFEAPSSLLGLYISSEDCNHMFGNMFLSCPDMAWSRYRNDHMLFFYKRLLNRYILTALKSSQEHCRKHFLRSLRPPPP